MGLRIVVVRLFRHSCIDFIQQMDGFKGLVAGFTLPVAIVLLRFLMQQFQLIPAYRAVCFFLLPQSFEKRNRFFSILKTKFLKQYPFHKNSPSTITRAKTPVTLQLLYHYIRQRKSRSQITLGSGRFFEAINRK